MTTQRVSLNGGWTGFQGVNGDDAVANTAASDLINILDAVEVPIVVVRRDLVVACFNKAAGDVLGLSPSDIGRRSRDISMLAGLPRLEEHCSQVIAVGLEMRIDFRDGDKWFVVRMSPYTGGDRHITGIVLTFINVTAFRASVDQAIYEREFTKAVLNTVADPLVVLSGDQRIQSGNRAFYTMFGVSRDEAQGLPFYELGNGAFGLAPLRTQFEEVLAGSHTFQPVEVDHVCPGKGQRTFVVDAHPLSLPGRSERRALVTFQDITARKQAEAAKDRLSEEALSKVRSELAHVARVSSLGVLTASIAHEINQPLSGIITNASTCLRMLGADPPNVEGARETARRTIRDGNRAHDVVTRLRALFKKRDVTTEPVDLNEATREVIALVLSDLQRDQVILRLELAEELQPVLGDRIQLQQVILNLVRNASEAMSCIDNRPKQLLVRTESEGDHVRVTVQDYGIGLDSQNTDQLFKAFYTTKRNGMGIGLSVSHSIIDSHHGRLWAVPNDGPGATFSFSLPCKAEHSSDAQSTSGTWTPAVSDAAAHVMRNS